MPLPVLDLSTFIRWAADRIVDAAKWVATKALIVAILFVLLPIAFWNLRVFIFNKIIPMILGYLNFDPVVLEYTGIAGFFASELKFDLCLGVLLAGLASRMAIRLIARI